MDRDALAARWRAVPEPLRWLGAYAASVLLALALGLLTPLGAGNALFLAGALAILASLAFIRLGSDRAKIVHRDLEGQIVAKERVPTPERKRQIAFGVKLFLMGLALWAPLPFLALLG